MNTENFKYITYQVTRGRARITLNRPEKRNALSIELVEELRDALWEADVPVLGTIKTTSALPFDIGVFLVVLGVILMAYEAFGEEAAEDEPAGDAPVSGAVNA